MYANKLTKDATAVPGVGPELAPVLQQEVELFVGAVTFGARRGLSSLLTAPSPSLAIRPPSFMG